jgi:hypothetical protein
MTANKTPKQATWYVVRRGGSADYQRCLEGREHLQFPYISGPYISRSIAERAAAQQRYEDNAPLRQWIAEHQEGK